MWSDRREAGVEPATAKEDEGHFCDAAFFVVTIDDGVKVFV